VAIVILILLVAAFVLLVLAALNVPSSRIGLGWAGLACAVLSELLKAVP
jgi:hypothetical protein